MEIAPFIILAFFMVAVFYSMAGFGGGSSYAALLLILGMSHTEIPKVSLVMNIAVAGTAFYVYFRGGHFHLKKILPYLVASLPMAFVGANIPVSRELFCGLLGVTLLVASTRLFLVFKTPSLGTSSFSWKICLVVGAILGLLSGVVGIGGGIFLSPFLVLTRQASIKEASAQASFFIVLNSISGLLGHVGQGAFPLETLLLLVPVVWIGGQIGSRLGAFRLPQLGLQRVLASLILLVALRILGGVL